MSKNTRKVRDPFLNKTVEVSSKLTDRLRGKYANGPTMPNGEPEFGWREFPSTPIQKEAADEIERLTKLCHDAYACIDVLANGIGKIATPDGFFTLWNETGMALEQLGAKPFKERARAA